jgi:DNA polymerase alpha subunit A
MKQRGGSAKAGDVIPYIFCLAEGEESAKSAQADRAKHPDELRKGGSTLKIGKSKRLFCDYISNYQYFADYDYYLSHQVFPPIERLCEPIEGTDKSRLAECLGQSKFKLEGRIVHTLTRLRFGPCTLSKLYRSR